jgi:signal transduction histidine kinase
MSYERQADEPGSGLPPAPAATSDSALFAVTLERLLGAGQVELHRCEAGQVVFRAGDVGDAAYYVRRGAVNIFGDNRDGQRRLVNHVRRGEVFGEMALIDRQGRVADAVAAEPCELIVIRADQILPLLRESPELSRWLLQQFSHRLRIMTRLVTEMEEVQEVNRRILAGQEEERRRIGRDVHDGVAQTFVDHILRVQLAQALLDTDPDRARSTLEHLETSLRDSKDRLRELIYDLYPKDLRNVGLVGAIERFAQRVAASHRLSIEFELCGVTASLPPTLESTLYCLVQEALHNVRNHANANQVHVALAQDERRLVLSVADDGDGFDLDRVLADETRRNSYGLLTMRERVRLAGGRTEIQTSPGAGTRLRFEFPLTDNTPEPNHESTT